VLDQIEVTQAVERFELEPNATSLKFLQMIYRSPAVPLMTRMRAAMAAIQFEHPKLGVTAIVEAGDFADQLEQAIERSRRIMIEAKPMIEANVSSTNVSSDTANISSDTANVPSETKRPSNGVKPMIPDRRFRR
jgi:hypothetical protein